MCVEQMDEQIQGAPYRHGLSVDAEGGRGHTSDQPPDGWGGLYKPEAHALSPKRPRWGTAGLLTAA